MKLLLNPRIAIHTTKIDLARKCLSPITHYYLTIYNNKRTRRTPHKTAKPTPSSTVKDLLRTYKKNELKPEELLQNFVKIPNRNSKHSIEIIPSIHLSFTLLWTQLALLAVGAEENKKLYQIVFNVPEKLLNKALKAMKKPKGNTTLIRALLKYANTKLPSSIKYWAVFEKGTKQNGNHIHIVAALDDSDKITLETALSQFESVKFKDHTSIDGKQYSIDIGAAYYYAKSMNKKYYGSNNLFVTPALNKLKKALESKYRDFIAESRPFLLSDKKVIQRSLQAYEQRRFDAIPKTYEEWEEKTLNQPTKELETTVYWQEVDGDQLEELDLLIASLE